MTRRLPPEDCDTRESQREYLEDIARELDAYDAEAETNR